LNSLLIDPNDLFNLVDKLKLLLYNNDLQEKLAKNAYNDVQNYDFKKYTLSKYLGIYNKLWL